MCHWFKLEAKFMINFTNTIGAIGLLLSIKDSFFWGVVVCGAMVSLRSTLEVIKAIKNVKN